MKKILLLISTLLLTTVSSAGWIEDTARGAGKALGTFGGAAVGSAAREALPSGDKIVAKAKMEEVSLTVSDSASTVQAVNNIEVYGDDVSFVEAHTYVDGDVIMYSDNCDRLCEQAVNRIIINSDGAGFSGVYAQAIITGAFKAKVEGGSGTTQAVNSIRVGNKP